MTKLIVTAVLGVMGSVASAQTIEFNWPDFSLQTRYEKDAIKGNADVQAYARKVGARSFKVTAGKSPILMYGVVTNNGCSFDVEVVYKSWPGIDDILVYKNAVCRR